MSERSKLLIRRLVLGLYAVDVFGFVLMTAPLIVGPLKSPSTVNIFHLSMTATAFALAALLFVPRRALMNRAGMAIVLSLVLFMGFMGLDMVLADRYENLWRAEMTIHIVLGIGVVAPFVLVFVATHAWRQRDLQWSRQGWVGHLSWIPFRVAMWCGVFAGFAVGPAWFFHVHRWGMALALMGVAIHLVYVHYAALRGRRMESSWGPRVAWREMEAGSRRAVLAVLVGGVAPVIGLRTWLAVDPSPRLLAQNDFIARRGVAVASEPNPTRFPRELLENSRASCGEFGCHEPLLQQWESSPHRHAANEFYRKAAEVVVREKGLAEVRLCAGCHDPVAILSGDLDPSNAVYPQKNGDEGISCLVCHSMKPHGEEIGNGSYEFTFPGRFFTRIQNIYTAHDLNEEHSAEFKSAAMRSPEACGACHRVVFPSSLTGSHEIVEQDPYTSWKEGPYHRRDHPRFVREADCLECHMVKDTRERPGWIEANHRFAASNSAQSHLNRDQDQARAVKDFLGGEIVVLSIEPVGERGRRGDPTTTHLVVPGAKRGGRFEVRVSNDRVGHVFPAGPLELNDVWMEAKAQDSEGHSLSIAFETQEQSDGIFQFGSFAGGRRLTRFTDLLGVDSVPMKVTVKPRETLIATADVNLEGAAPGGVRIDVRLLYRKFSPQFSKWVLGYDADLPVIEMAKASRVIPFAPLRGRRAESLWDPRVVEWR